MRSIDQAWQPCPGGGAGSCGVSAGCSRENLAEIDAYLLRCALEGEIREALRYYMYALGHLRTGMGRDEYVEECLRFSSRLLVDIDFEAKEGGRFVGTNNTARDRSLSPTDISGRELLRDRIEKCLYNTGPSENLSAVDFHVIKAICGSLDLRTGCAWGERIWPASSECLFLCPPKFKIVLKDRLVVIPI